MSQGVAPRHPQADRLVQAAPVLTPCPRHRLARGQDVAQKNASIPSTTVTVAGAATPHPGRIWSSKTISIYFYSSGKQVIAQNKTAFIGCFL